MSKKEAAKLKRLIFNRVVAEISDSWKGAGDPESFPEIAKNLKKAKDELREFIDSLTVQDGTGNSSEGEG